MDDYVGYCGFQYCEISGGMEILYGYAKQYWGKGYAIEAAKAVLRFGLTRLNLDEILAFDKILNEIGMTYIGDIEWPKEGMVKKYMIVKYDWFGCEIPIKKGVKR